MFSRASDASKIALTALATLLNAKGFDMIDCQVTTPHLVNMGAVEVSREQFLNALTPSIERQMNPNIWDPCRPLDPLPANKEKK